jgi:hypothetical protein
MHHGHSLHAACIAALEALVQFERHPRRYPKSSSKVNTGKKSPSSNMTLTTQAMTL